MASQKPSGNESSVILNANPSISIESSKVSTERFDGEKKFMDFLRENPDDSLPGLRVIHQEYSMYGAMEVLRRESNLQVYGEVERRREGQIGRIDLIFYYRRKIWIGEVKWQRFDGKDFWDACKVVAYAEYYKWIHNPMDTIAPAILMPRDRIKLEHQIIANKLKIGLFGIKKDKDRYTLEYVNKH